MDEDEKDLWVSWLWPMSLVSALGLVFWVGADSPQLFWMSTPLFVALSIAWLFRVTYLKGRGGNR